MSLINFSFLHNLSIYIACTFIDKNISTISISSILKFQFTPKFLQKSGKRRWKTRKRNIFHGKRAQ